MRKISTLARLFAVIAVLSCPLLAQNHPAAMETASIDATKSTALMNIGSCGSAAEPTWCNAPVIKYQARGSGYSGSWSCAFTGGMLINEGTPAICSASVINGGLFFTVTSPGQYSQAPSGITFTGGSYTPGTASRVTLDTSSTAGEWINAALVSCPATGCRIEVPPADGPMYLNEPIVVTKPSVHLTCDTKDPLQITYGTTSMGPNGYFFNPIDVAADNFELDGCHIDMTAMGPIMEEAVNFFGATNGKVYNNQITSSMPVAVYQARGALGIRVQGNEAHPSKWIDIYDNDITVPFIGLSTGNYAYYVNFHDNRVANSYECFDLNGSGASPNVSASINVTGNQCINNLSSSYVESAYAVNIKGNFFWYNGIAQQGGDPQAVLRIHAITPYNLQNTIVSDNQFYGNASGAYGIHIFNGSNNVQVAGNQFFNIGLDAILIDGSAGGVVTGLIQGNYIQRTGVNTTYSPGTTYCGIHIRTAGAGANVWNVSILDNVVQYSANGICHTDASAKPAAPMGLKILGNDVAAPASVPFGNQVSLSLPYGCEGCTIGPNHLDNSGTSRFDGVVFADSLQTTATTVAALPACDATTLLQRRAVTDAKVATPGSLAAGGGTNTIAVECVSNRGGAAYSWIID